jgi:hypothetical protein
MISRIQVQTSELASCQFSQVLYSRTPRCPTRARPCGSRIRPPRSRRFRTRIRARRSRRCLGATGRGVDPGRIKDRLRCQLEGARNAYAPEKARPVTFVTGATNLACLDQEHIAIAIEPDRLDVLNVSRSRPLVPVRPPRTGKEMRLPGRHRVSQGWLIHPGHHQNFAIVRVLDDRRDQTLIVPFQSGHER